MTPIRSAALLLAALAGLAACDPVSPETSSSSGSSVARLGSLGFRTAATGAGGAPSAMSYMGQINRAVLCRRGEGPYQSGALVLPGARLDAYVLLSGGRVVDGVYAVTLREGGAIKGITFSPRGAATLASGVTCRAA